MNNFSDSRKRLRARDANELPTESKMKSEQWQLSSSRHCVACGKISCNCRGQVDPELKRRRLDELLRNTPYAKRKILQCTDELRREEKKQRTALEHRWKVSREELESSCRGLCNLAQLARLEEDTRRALHAEESCLFDMVSMSAQQSRNLVFCLFCESQARTAVRAEEGAARMFLKEAKFLLRSCSHLCAHEHQLREQVLLQETSERAALQTLMAQHRQHLHSHLLDLQDLYRVWQSGQELNYFEWCDGITELSCHRESAFQLLKEQFQERQQTAVQMWNMKSSIVEEEYAVRTRLVQQMRAEGVRIKERQMEHLRRVQLVVLEENQLRVKILHDTLQQWDQIFREMEESKKDADMREGHRREFLRTEAQKCLQRKELIRLEEADSFLKILLQEEQEREECFHWVKQQQLRCEAFVDSCFVAKHSLFTQEETARRNLQQKFLEDYERRLQWLSAKEGHVQALILQEAEGRKEVMKREHDELFHWYNRKGEEEIIALRLHERRKVERQAVEREESCTRIKCVMSEENCRELLFKQFVKEDEVITAFVDHQRCAILAFEKKAKDEYEALVVEETSLWEDKMQSFHQGFQEVVEIQFYKKLCTVEKDEARRRALLFQEEAGSRNHVNALQEVLQCSYLEAIAGQHEFAVEGLTENECFSRSTLRELEDRSFAHLLLLERSSRKEILHMEADALIQQQRKEAAHQVEDGLNALRQNLVKQSLLMDDTVNLDYHHSLYLSQVIDAVNNRRNDLQSETGLSVAVAEESERRIERLRSVLQEKQEQKERYENKCKRNREDLEKWQETLKDNRKRYKKELQMESNKFQQSERELKKANGALQTLKNSINNHFKGSS